MLPHAPQLTASVAMFCSQPVALFPSQSAKPAAQASPHLPLAQTAVELGPAVQTTPQVPQFTGVAVDVSHPLARLLSQSAQPALQATSVQRPAWQVAAALGMGHAVPSVAVGFVQVPVDG